MQIQKLPLRGSFYVAAGINVLCIIGVLISIRSLPPVVPLFYGRAVGPGQLVSSVMLTIAPITSLVIGGANFFLASIVREVFVKKVLAVASLFISLLSLITITKIIFLVSFG